MSWSALCRRGFCYAATGLVNTLVGLATVLVSRRVFGWSEYVANASGYIVGVAIGFLLNRSWTFRHSGSVRISAPLYVAAFAACYLLNLLVLKIALSCLQWPAPVAQAMAIGVYSITFFVVCKKIVFAGAHRREGSFISNRDSNLDGVSVASLPERHEEGRSSATA